MAQLDFKQIKNFPSLTPKEQTAYLYKLILLILLQNYQTGLPINDATLLNELQNAMNQNSEITSII